MRMLSLTVLLCAGLGAVPVAAFAQDAAGGSHVYKLHAQNGSHEYGTVALKPQGASTVVEVHVINAPPGTMQPAHIHLGTCAQLNPAPKYPLTSILDGTSSTTVAATTASLLQTPMAINVHKSAADLKSYVACADLKP